MGLGPAASGGLQGQGQAAAQRQRASAGQERAWLASNLLGAGLGGKRQQAITDGRPVDRSRELERVLGPMLAAPWDSRPGRAEQSIADEPSRTSGDGRATKWPCSKKNTRGGDEGFLTFIWRRCRVRSRILHWQVVGSFSLLVAALWFWTRSLFVFCTPHQMLWALSLFQRLPTLYRKPAIVLYTLSAG